MIKALEEYITFYSGIVINKMDKEKIFDLQ
jgi:hypothetical protein